MWKELKENRRRVDSEWFLKIRQKYINYILRSYQRSNDRCKVYFVLRVKADFLTLVPRVAVLYEKDDTELEGEGVA